MGLACVCMCVSESCVVCGLSVCVCGVCGVWFLCLDLEFAVAKDDEGSVLHMLREVAHLPDLVGVDVEGGHLLRSVAVS